MRLFHRHQENKTKKRCVDGIAAELLLLVCHSFDSPMKFEWQTGRSMLWHLCIIQVVGTCWLRTARRAICILKRMPLYSRYTQSAIFMGPGFPLRRVPPHSLALIFANKLRPRPYYASFSLFMLFPLNSWNSTNLI